MKIRNSSFLLCAILFSFLSSLSWAAPREVVVFPKFARVTETTKFRLLADGKEFRKAAIILPGQAEPSSLIIHPPQDTKLKIEDLSWRNVKRDGDAKTKAIRSRLKQMKEERNSLAGLIHALDAQIQFWQQQTKAKAKTPAEAGVISATMGKNIRKAFQEKLDRQPDIAALDKRIKELQEELNLSIEKDEGVWEITVLLSGRPAGEAWLSYSYTLADCGWLPFYRLDAHPQLGQIQFCWEAEVWQNSGETWNDVNLALSDMQASVSLAPTDIPPWIIRPRQEAKRKGKRSGKADDREVQQPTHQGAFTLWQAGKKTIPSGSPQTIKIREETWPADFSYLARPSQSPLAYVTALPRLAEKSELSRGNAVFLLEGALMGKNNFALSGQQETLFFGQDPLVTVTRSLLSDPTNDKNTCRRQWRFDAQNAKDSPIKLRIEVPVPQTADERIKIINNYDPHPAELTKSSLFWDIELSAGQKKTIVWRVEMKPPPDCEIDPGWK